MELNLLRHAIAIDRESFPNEDSQRPLTNEGKEKMIEIAKGMVALGLSFDTIVSSPYLRAKQTAEIVCKEFRFKETIRISQNLIPEGDFEALSKEIDSKLSKSKSILMVGHEPHLSGFISYLLAGKSFPINLKKGGLCNLFIEPPVSKSSAHLNWLLSPVQLRQLAHK